MNPALCIISIPSLRGADPDPVRGDSGKELLQFLLAMTFSD
jgi:hypothetical protein